MGPQTETGTTLPSIGQGSSGPLLDDVLAAMLEVLEAGKATVHLHDRGAGTLRLVAQRGLEPWELDEHRMAGVDASPWGRAFQRRSGTTVEDLPGEGHRVLQSR